MRRRFSCFLAAFALVHLPGLLRAQCSPLWNGSTVLVETDDFSLSAESASGAAGDVVGVTVLLRSSLVDQGWPAMEITVCHDPRVAELVGSPSYSEELLSLLGVSGVQSYLVDESAGLSGDHRGHGLIIEIGFERQLYEAKFPSDMPLTLMTLYYRLKGSPGDTGAVTFCNGVLGRWNARCLYNKIHTYSGDNPPGWDFISRRNPEGTLTVLEGPATHPDRPPEPPEAKVYPELPSGASVNFRVRIAGAASRPGAREVPVEVYVSADVEYSAIQVPIDFDERYLHLARAEDHFVTGTTLVDNRDDTPGADTEEGNAVVFSGLGVNSRRLAAEGEEVHAATLYFDVLEAASAVSSTTLSVVPVTDSRGLLFRPWIGVQYRNGLATGDPVVRSEVSPIAITEGVFLLRPGTLVPRGDANFDGQVDITDPLVELSFLFQGGPEPICRGAADFNRDGRLNIADPIATLTALFFSPLPPDGGEPSEAACR